MGVDAQLHTNTSSVQLELQMNAMIHVAAAAPTQRLADVTMIQAFLRSQPHQRIFDPHTTLPR